MPELQTDIDAAYKMFADEAEILLCRHESKYRALCRKYAPAHMIDDIYADLVVYMMPVYIYQWIPSKGYSLDVFICNRIIQKIRQRLGQKSKEELLEDDVSYDCRDCEDFLLDIEGIDPYDKWLIEQIVLHGHKVSHIAKAIGRSPHTIRTQIERIFKKYPGIFAN